MEIFVDSTKHFSGFNVREIVLSINDNCCEFLASGGVKFIH